MPNAPKCFGCGKETHRETVVSYRPSTPDEIAAAEKLRAQAAEADYPKAAELARRANRLACPADRFRSWLSRPIPEGAEYLAEVRELGDYRPLGYGQFCRLVCAQTFARAVADLYELGEKIQGVSFGRVIDRARGLTAGAMNRK